MNIAIRNGLFKFRRNCSFAKRAYIAGDIYDDEERAPPPLGAEPDQYVPHSFKKIELPEAPTNCCMSGCANCVWVKYAQELTKLFQDGGENARKIILESIQDENMKAYLMMELNIQKTKDCMNTKSDD